MLKVQHTTRFKKDLKLMVKRGKNSEKLKIIMKKIVKQSRLPVKLKDHALGGNWQGFRECHIEPDWLLIYELKLNLKMVIFTRTGTHSDLFR